MAMYTNASSLSGVRSYDLERRRERFSQPNVRSTIQRLGWISNRPRGRRTISTTHNQRTNAQPTRATYAWSAQRTFGNFTDLRNAASTSLPPSRSCTLAGVMTSAHSSPSVSTTMCRLRPLTFFPRIVATRPALFGRFHSLAVEDARSRLGGLARLSSDPFTNLGVESFPSAVLLPQSKVMKDDPVRRQVVRQRSPRASVAGQIPDGVDDFPTTVLCGSSARLRFGNPRGNPSPLGVCQVGGVGVPSHAPKDIASPILHQDHFLDTL